MMSASDSAAALAFGPKVVVAPAMNDAMFANPATQANLATLAARGATVVTPGEGELACGTSGRGRLADLPDILAAVSAALKTGR